jgi:hypothetical protein
MYDFLNRLRGVNVSILRRFFPVQRVIHIECNRAGLYKSIFTCCSYRALTDLVASNTGDLLFRNILFNRKFK